VPPFTSSPATSGAEDLGATIESASGGLGGTPTVAAEGTVGSTEFAICATIDGPLTFGQIRGTVAGTPIRIDAAAVGNGWVAVGWLLTGWS
jgi:hypothetical protein